jgi:hypothetical protein
MFYAFNDTDESMDDIKTYIFLITGGVKNGSKNIANAVYK